jgi:ABC-type dipeptide/oligopeptide/nickel transport system permease component
VQGLASYVLRRLLWAPFILFFISIVTFSLGRFAPGDYVEKQAGPRANPETIERIKEDRGLNDPVLIQYGRYMLDAFQGDFGDSVIYRGVDVEDVIFPRLWVTLQYNTLVLILTFAIGIPVGAWAALKRGTWLDPLAIGTFLLFASVPIVVSIPLLQWLFSVKLGWLPSGGWEVREFFGIEIGIFSKQIILPVLILTLPGVAVVARYMRAQVMEVLDQDYVRTAHAKGLDIFAVVRGHVIRNALLPIVTILGFELAGLLAGSIFLEMLLGIPGIGSYAFESINSDDYNSIMAIVLIGYRFHPRQHPCRCCLRIHRPPHPCQRQRTVVAYVDASAQALEEPAAPAPASFRVLRRLLRRPVAVVALTVIAVVYLAGIFAPVIAPYGYSEPDFDNTLSGPSWEHPLGTDRLGRDLLSRVIWSAQTTVIISAAATLAGGLALGVALGLLSGYLGGRVDSLIMRLADAFYSVPTLLLLIIINATFRERVVDFFGEVESLTGIGGIVGRGIPDYFLVFGALSIFGWVGMARMVRSQVLSLREADFVLAAAASGASTARILFRHLLPNVGNIILVALTFLLGAAALAEVGLSFLGIGVQPPRPTFGAMIFQGSGLTNLRAHPILLLVPAAVVASLMLSFNLLGDVLMDILSPRRR